MSSYLVSSEVVRLLRVFRLKAGLPVETSMYVDADETVGLGLVAARRIQLSALSGQMLDQLANREITELLERREWHRSEAVAPTTEPIAADEEVFVNMNFVEEQAEGGELTDQEHRASAEGLSQKVTATTGAVSPQTVVRGARESDPALAERLDAIRKTLTDAKISTVGPIDIGGKKCRVCGIHQPWARGFCPTCESVQRSEREERGQRRRAAGQTGIAVTAAAIAAKEVVLAALGRTPSQKRNMALIPNGGPLEANFTGVFSGQRLFVIAIEISTTTVFIAPSKALVDTGAMVNLVSEPMMDKVAQMLELGQRFPAEGDEGSLMVSGVTDVSAMRALKRARMVFIPGKPDQTTVAYLAYLMKSAHVDCILSFDLLAGMGALIDCGRRILIMTSASHRKFVFPLVTAASTEQAMMAFADEQALPQSPREQLYEDQYEEEFESGLSGQVLDIGPAPTPVCGHGYFTLDEGLSILKCTPHPAEGCLNQGRRGEEPGLTCYVRIDIRQHLPSAAECVYTKQSDCVSIRMSTQLEVEERTFMTIREACQGAMEKAALEFGLYPVSGGFSLAQLGLIQYTSEPLQISPATYVMARLVIGSTVLNPRVPTVLQRQGSDMRADWSMAALVAKAGEVQMTSRHNLGALLFQVSENGDSCGVSSLYWLRKAKELQLPMHGFAVAGGRCVYPRLRWKSIEVELDTLLRALCKNKDIRRFSEATILDALRDSANEHWAKQVKLCGDLAVTVIACKEEIALWESCVHMAAASEALEALDAMVSTLLSTVAENRQRLVMGHAVKEQPEWEMHPGDDHEYLGELYNRIASELALVRGLADEEKCRGCEEVSQEDLTHFAAERGARELIRDSLLSTGSHWALKGMIAALSRRVHLSNIVRDEAVKREHELVTRRLATLTVRLCDAAREERLHQIWNLRRERVQLITIPRLRDIARERQQQIIDNESFQSSQAGLHTA